MVIRKKILLFCLFFIFIFSAAIMSELVVEEVDVSNLQLAQIKVMYDLDPTYMQYLTEDALVARCESLSTIEPGTCSVNIIKGQNKVIFNMIEPISLSVNDVKVDKTKTELKIYYRYLPKQFRLATGLEVKETKLKISYPTHTTRLSTVLDTPHISEFILSGETKKLVAKLDKTSYVIGESISIPKLNGQLCVAAIFDGDQLKLRESSQNCESFRLGTSSGSITGGKNYMLYLIAYDGGVLSMKGIPIAFTSGGLTLDVNIDKDSCYLGEKFTVKISSDAQLDTCVITVYDANHIKKDFRSFYCEPEMPITASTSWGPGKYLVEIRAFDIDGNDVFGSDNIELISIGMSKAEVSTGKDVYTPGEKVTVFTDTVGDFCTYNLYNSNGISVGETNSVGCDLTSLDIDETLEPGMYSIKARVYKDGQKVSHSATEVQISEWRPKARTAMSDLCTSGSLFLLGEEFPCITEQQTCIPSSTSKPLCLCFNKKQEPVFFCKYGESCSASGCKKNSAIDSPFTIIYQNARCFAKRGVQTLTCIELGELCSSNCVCLEKDSKAPLEHCSIGEACTPEGCKPARLEFEVDKVTASEESSNIAQNERITFVYQDDLKEGNAEITWRGRIKYNNRPLDNSALPDIYFEGLLHNINGRVSSPEFLGNEEGWKVKTTFKGELTPGKYELFFITKYNDEIHVLRKTIQVWFPKKQNQFNLKISQNSIHPEQLSKKDMRYGTGTRVRMGISDAMTRKTITEKDLAPNGIKVWLSKDKKVDKNDLSAYGLNAEFEPISQKWIITANFREKDAKDYNYIFIHVNYYGRQGKIYKELKVRENIPLTMKIIDIIPGAREENPLYYRLVTTGFDMDIYLQLGGSLDGITKNSFDVKFGNYRIDKSKIQYATSTLQGYRLHLTNIRLCDPAPPSGSTHKVAVTAQGDQNKVTDHLEVKVLKNPGDFTFRREVSC